jgi:zinc-finger of transposase IS204/IS1001/IS1096/IS1165
VEEHGSATPSVALLGLGEFVVLAAAEVAGEVELLVETTATVAGCPRCGVVAEPHGRRPVTVRDLPFAGRPTALVWSNRLHLVGGEPGDPTRERCSRSGRGPGRWE